MENWSNLNKFLTLEKKDSDYRDSLSKTLIEAISKKEMKKIKNTLKEGASVNCFDEHLTPLIVTIDNDDFELFNFLLQINASVNYRPKPKFIDAFWYSLINKKHQFLNSFISLKNPLTRHPETNQTALIYATNETDLFGVKVLLRHYAIRVNERDNLGNTALFYNLAKESPTQEDIEIGQLLLAAGAETNTRNLEGKTIKESITSNDSKIILERAELTKTVDAVIEEKVESVPDAPKPIKKNKI